MGAETVDRSPAVLSANEGNRLLSDRDTVYFASCEPVDRANLDPLLLGRLLSTV